MHELILIIFDTSVAEKVGNQKYIIRCYKEDSSCIANLPALALNVNKNSSGDEIANVKFFYNIAHVEASDYAH